MIFMKNEETISKTKRTVTIIVCVVLSLLILIGAGAVVFVNQTLNLINRDTVPEETLSDAEIESILNETEAVTEPVESMETKMTEVTDATVETEEPTEVEEEEHGENTENAEVLEEEDYILNILLIGQDRQANQERQRSDSMILCTVNQKEKTLVLTSFLRDTYVSIPAWEGKKYGKNRLNVCYPIGGMEMLDQCLEDNFGVVVDYNVEVDFFSFAKIVDLMGGVDIELTKAEAGLINRGYDLGGYLQEGMNHLNGDLALFYARTRKLDSDFGRTERQRKVILALMENAKDMSLLDAYNIISEVFPMITTDMTNRDILNLALKLLPLLSELQVTSQHIPAEGTYLFGQVPGMSAISADMEANRQILRDTIGIE